MFVCQLIILTFTMFPLKFMVFSGSYLLDSNQKYLFFKQLFYNKGHSLKNLLPYPMSEFQESQKTGISFRKKNIQCLYEIPQNLNLNFLVLNVTFSNISAILYWTGSSKLNQFEAQKRRYSTMAEVFTKSSNEQVKN